MKKLILVFCMALLSKESVAFEAGQLSLDTPNVLKKSEGVFWDTSSFFW